MITEKLNPFNLEQAKAGAPVCTRDGLEARYVTDIKNTTGTHVFIVTSVIGEEYPYYYDDSGVCPHAGESRDLFMKPQKIERWVNFYKDSEGYIRTMGIYREKEDALNEINNIKSRHLCTTMIEWYE